MKFPPFMPASGALLGLYCLGTILYFSHTPPSRYYCPVKVPGRAKIKKRDPRYPDHRFSVINDISCLNETRVYSIVQVTSQEDIAQALTTARTKKLHVAAAGVRHSMGGQAFFDDAIILDMTGFNKILAFDLERKTITVESGLSWHDLQTFIHDRDLAVLAMQSTDIFTIGGSLSVNAHGMDHHAGSVIQTVESLTIMLADGSVVTATPTENTELFNAVIGGYGLFGIILTVTLKLTDNVMYERVSQTLPYRDFPAYFADMSQKDPFDLFYAHLSTSPLNFLDEMLLYGYKQVPHIGAFKPLKKLPLIRTRRYLLNLSKRRAYARIARWFAEKYIDPALESSSGQRQLSRNDVMHDSVEYLDNVLINETDILQEYFIPHEQFVPYITTLRAILKTHRIPLLNASVRIVHQQANTLNYAPQDMFAVVLYLNQRVTTAALQDMEHLTQEIIDATLKVGGTFFLPYQLHFTVEQLKKAYPNIDAFFALKRRWDPELLFMNKFYATYAPEELMHPHLTDHHSTGLHQTDDTTKHQTSHPTMTPVVQTQAQV